MRIAFLADLHMDYLWHEKLSEQKEQKIAELAKEVDALILCGDNAAVFTNLEHHRRLYRAIREHFNGPVASVLGNHDLWSEYCLRTIPLLMHHHPRLMAEFDIINLEAQNLDLDGLTIAGTYGHYDYSLGLRQADLGESDWENGEAVVYGHPESFLDKKMQDWEGKHDREVCKELLDAFESRLASAAQPLITISHTVPRADLIPHPQTPEHIFCSGYRGSSEIGRLVHAYTSMLHVSGHAHAYGRAKEYPTTFISMGAEINIWTRFVFNTQNRHESVHLEALRDEDEDSQDG